LFFTVIDVGPLPISKELEIVLFAGLIFNNLFEIVYKGLTVGVIDNLFV
jgi:hypothetical protein